MSVVIQVAPKDSTRAWSLLVRHSPGKALPNHIFVVSEESARSLREAGVEFTELSKEPLNPLFEGDVVGERI